MFTVPRRLPAAAFIAAIVTIAPACASPGALYRYPSGGRQVDDRAYTQGYEEGREDGERDARSGRRYDYARHDDFRDADDGYRGYGQRNAYRDLFRQGFIAGYDDGYRRNARRGSAGYPNTYPGGVYGGRGDRGGRYASPASENG